MPNTQLQLPYPDLPPLATRDTLRKNSKTGKDTYYISFDKIRIRPGFNIRVKPDDVSEKQWLEDLHIEELALDMAQNGQKDALVGDLSSDGKDFYLTDGYRRFLAIHWLLENCYTTQKNGKPMDQVEVICNPSGTTEKDRLFSMLASNKKLPYKKTEIAAGVLRAVQIFQMSHDEVAAQMGMSRQWVDNMVILASQPESIQQAVNAGQIAVTAAVTLARTVKDVNEREKVVADAVSAGHTIQVKDVDPVLLKKAEDKFNGIGGQPDISMDEVALYQSPGVSVKTETKLALDEEMDSHKTDGKFREPRKKSDGNDALGKIDFTKEKTEAEMALNEVIKMLDKMNVMAGTLPDAMKGMRDDYQRLCAICASKVLEAQEIIKKAADER